MPTLEEQFEAACQALDIPGAVLVASDATGAFEYKRAFGKSTLKKGSEKPLELDAAFVIASCTKLMTTIAALQCVERGQIGLDDDVSTVLHELAGIEILTGFEEKTGKPILKKAEKKITLRHLLTHSSGIAYDLMDPLLRQWRTYRGEPVSITGMPILKRILVPLLYEPGTSWMYGGSMDWAGVLVSRLNGGLSLQDYMQNHLWDPLGIKDMTFHWEQHPSMRERRVTNSKREGPVDEWGLAANPNAKVTWTDETLYDDPTPDEYGGAGAMATGPDYLKILQAILANDGRLLQPPMVDEMFRPQLSPKSKEAFAAFLAVPQFNAAMWGGPMGIKLDWGLGGMMVMEDLPSGRKKGSISWSGLPNLHWWIDSKTGLCGMYASQVLPYGDAKSAEMHQLFEKEMYQRLEAMRNSFKI